MDPAGRLFIADRNQAKASFVPTPDGNRIRMVDTDGNISTVYGSTAGYNGENVLSSASASGGPVALASDPQGNIYVEDSDSQRIRVLTPTNNPVQITFVQTSGGFPNIAQNDFIEIYGVNLAPDSVGPGMDWSAAPEFLSGRMPAQLAGVSVTVNGKPAFVYFVSKSQVNVLTPLDSATGPVTIAVTNGANSSPPFTINLGAAAPAFLRFGGTKYVAAQHANYSLLGPPSLSIPGAAYTPAKPGETILLYAVGFGLPKTPITNGSSMQSGVLPVLPEVKIGGLHANVYAAIVGPGLTQMNVTVPMGVPSADNEITVTYDGAATPLGVYVAVQAP